MKAVKFILSTLVLLVFFGLNNSHGQWLFNGNHIYNTNSQNVGIGTGGLWTPTEKLHINNGTTPARILVEMSYGGSTGMQAISSLRLQNSATGDLYQAILRKNNASHQMVQSCYDASAGAWREFNFFDFATRKYEMRAGILDAEFLNAGNLLFNNAGDVGIDILPDGNGLNVLHYTYGKAAVQGLDNSGGFTYAAGMLGVLDPASMGVPVYAYNAGVLGIKPNLGANGAAVYGWNLDANNSANYGGLFAADGAATATNYTNFGVYGVAKHANLNYAGKFFGRVEVDGHPSASEAPDYTYTVFKSTVGHTLSVDTRAVEGISVPADGYGIGVDGTGGWMGVRGVASAGAYTGSSYGVYGTASGTTGTRIGVYGTASGGTTNWAGYFAGDAYVSSDLRIATTTQATGYALSVNGKIACEEVLVEDLTSWPDYVFDESYNLLSIDELEKSIQENNHLPGLPSAAEIEENGLSLGDMQKRMIEKIEELTLYTIQQNKMIKELQQKMEMLEKENARLSKRAD